MLNTSMKARYLRPAFFHLQFLLLIFVLFSTSDVLMAQGNRPMRMRWPNQNGIVNIDSLRWRDNCILADPVSKTYYMIGSKGRSVGCYSSKDLKTWEGPTLIYTAPQDVWGDIPIVSIWAPEMHYYNGKYYLFLTFDSRNKFPEQWRFWDSNGRVTRGSQILVSDSPTGPYTAFAQHSTTPVDMMALDGTLWVEDGIPYMVFCHEWVQITDGGICYIKLKDDLSETIGEPTYIVRASHVSHTWGTISDLEGKGYVTDGPYLYKGKSGKLYMIWTTNNSCGIVVSESGKLAGPWTHQDEALFVNGGHGMIFKSFEGKLLLCLHAPYWGETRPRIFELEDTGETLKIVKELNK